MPRGVRRQGLRGRVSCWQRGSGVPRVARRSLSGVFDPSAEAGPGDIGIRSVGGLLAAAVAWDAWRAVRAGPAGVEARQQRRLGLLVEYAREHSRFYAERFRDLLAGPVELRRLPAVSKSELMDRFDDWITDPAVTRAAVEVFVADLDNLGADFDGRYVVFTTSGSTGVPTLLVQDRRALAVMNGLAFVRSAGWLTPRVLVRMLVRGVRQAASLTLRRRAPTRVRPERHWRGVVRRFGSRPVNGRRRGSIRPPGV